MLGPGFLIAILAATGASARLQPETPVVAVAYRGTPAGTPKSEDLALVRAAGFTGVRWAPEDRAAFDTLTRLAGPLDLTVLTAPGVTVKVDRPRPDLQALLWRAIAGGARVITIDAGQSAGTGLVNGKGERLPWTYTASAFAGQISASGRLFAATRPGPAVIMAPPLPKGVEVTLLDGGRGWVLIATSTARTRVPFVAQLPADVPPALWVSLVDGGTMSMLRQASGPRWTAAIEPGGALVYVIDKAPR
ncbi:MAG TPA: hypothetical protein VFO31_20355 [Vicinamibacterales bacterium]|nr:hypothetical protein [Vicinamibacterales bacterium]